MKKAIILSLGLLTLAPTVSFGALVKVSMDYKVPPQNTSWSCGPNAATWMMQFYGTDVTYELMRKGCPNIDLQLEVPKLLPSIMPRISAMISKKNVFLGMGFAFMGSRIITEKLKSLPNGSKIGPSPEKLAEYMNLMAKGTATYRVIEGEGVIDEAIASILQNEPVMAMVRLSELDLADEAKMSRQDLDGMGITSEVLDAIGKIPALHYIVLNGYDEETSEFTYIDPSDGKEHIQMYEDLKKNWYWEDGKGMIGDFIKQRGAHGRAMIVGSISPKSTIPTPPTAPFPQTSLSGNVAMEQKNPLGPFAQAQQGLTAVSKPAIYGIWKGNEVFEVGDVRRMQTLTFSENKVTSLIHCTFLDGTQGSVTVSSRATLNGAFIDVEEAKKVSVTGASGNVCRAGIAKRRFKFGVDGNTLSLTDIRYTLPDLFTRQ